MVAGTHRCVALMMRMLYGHVERTRYLKIIKRDDIAKHHTLENIYYSKGNEHVIWVIGYHTTYKELKAKTINPLDQDMKTFPMLRLHQATFSQQDCLADRRGSVTTIGSCTQALLVTRLGVSTRLLCGAASTLLDDVAAINGVLLVTF